MASRSSTSSIRRVNSTDVPVVTPPRRTTTSSAPRTPTKTATRPAARPTAAVTPSPSTRTGGVTRSTSSPLPRPLTSSANGGAPVSRRATSGSTTRSSPLSRYQTPPPEPHQLVSFQSPPPAPRKVAPAPASASASASPTPTATATAATKRKSRPSTSQGSRPVVAKPRVHDTPGFVSFGDFDELPAKPAPKEESPKRRAPPPELVSLATPANAATMPATARGDVSKTPTIVSIGQITLERVIKNDIRAITRAAFGPNGPPNQPQPATGNGWHGS